MASIFDEDLALTKICGEFIDLTDDVNLVFCEAIKQYMCCQMNEYDAYINQIRNLESKGDVIRRQAESRLYTEKLIPESRGDLLGLIETTDDIIDETKNTALLFSVEIPDIPLELRNEFVSLAKICTEAVNEVLVAFRIFFKSPESVKNLIQPVYDKEKLADKQAAKIKRLAFLDKNLPLSQKMHLRYFAHHVDCIADRAEDLADRLSIAAIRQTIKA